MHTYVLLVAGTVSIEQMTGWALPFCPGRVDANADNGASDFLAPRTYSDPLIEVRDNAKVMGLTSREAVALAAVPRSPSQQSRLGYSGAWANDVSVLSNQFYKDLLNKNWAQNYGPGGLVQVGHNHAAHVYTHAHLPHLAPLLFPQTHMHTQGSALPCPRFSCKHSTTTTHTHTHTQR